MPASPSTTEFSAAPNPFSLVSDSNETRFAKLISKARFSRSLKTLAATLVVTGVLLSGVYFGKQWLLHQLIADFEALAPSDKQTRLIQIASFGTSAIEPLANRLVDQEDEVSESAFVLLQQMQNEWITLSRTDAIEAHQRLVAAIAITYGIQASEQAVPDRLTTAQIARGRELLNQVILEFASVENVEDNLDAQRLSGNLVQWANQLLARMRFPGSGTTPGQLADGLKTNQSVENPNLSSISSFDNRWGMTDWPPPSRNRSGRPTDAQIIGSGSKRNLTDSGASGLHPIPKGTTVPLTQIVTPSRSTKVLAARPPVGNRQPVVIQETTSQSMLQTVSHLAPSPLTALDDETVIRHLANPDALVAEQARAELVGRGFTPAQMEMAQAIAVANPSDRIRLIESLLHSSQLNSGPWLSMMLDDPDRSVRLHVISTLAATLANRTDPAIVSQLRRRLAREQDTHVATRLRKVLDLR